MIKMMIKECEQLVNGKERWQAQIDELFPDGFEAHLEIQQANTFDFTPICNAILEADCNAVARALNKEGAAFSESDEAKEKPDNKLTLTEALNRFRAMFTEFSHIEKIFNPNHLLRALTIVEESLMTISPYEAKRKLFWRQVYGFTQRFWPAYDAQASAFGLYDYVKNNEAHPRSLKLKNSEFFSFYPVDNSCSGLGFDCAVDAAEVLSCSGRVEWAGMRTEQYWYKRTRSLYEKFIKKKNLAVKNLYVRSHRLCIIQ
ncbi:unnamed protein product [marine sediment metagenome]|uniref:Uncharacterized protein n=1 Tax=marine sediment metagenome TaxID=412755 RepID=X1CFM0_9ZZZZ